MNLVLSSLMVRPIFPAAFANETNAQTRARLVLPAVKWFSERWFHLYFLSLMAMVNYRQEGSSLHRIVS
ncbi:hypothetical protein CDAR_305781 [Caerostris darwini]|uniref:Uncharacterized protein n=1 Tax=Caerostris darwini TaxID=1538125 RepID=A0AAV4VSV8_9ARAC|nr:hypothetical protein CDAR_305781 [Caerostris darwini]